MAVRFASDSDKLNRMFDASLESIRYRQDLYATGGIVESDHRQDNGFLYGGGEVCYPRVHVARNLLSFGEVERTERFCRFWLNAMPPKGGFPKCLPAATGRAPSGSDMGETDSHAHVLRHWGEYVAGTGDRAFLSDALPAVRALVDVARGFYNPEFRLCAGEEEAIVLNPEGETGSDEHPHIPGYSMQINVAFHLGLCHAARMLQAAGDAERAHQTAALAEDIREGIRTNLWDREERRYLFGLAPDGRPYRGAMWFSLHYPYLTETWDGPAERTFQDLWEKLQDRDPRLPGTYWSNDFSLLAERKHSRHSRYSGAGPYIGVSAAVCHMLLMAGRLDTAGEHLDMILRHTDDTDLIAEHINTLSPGREGRFKLYPETPCRVDRGNLFHMSFFLSLIRWMVGGRDGWRLIPSLPDTIHALDVEGLPWGDGSLDYAYRTDGEQAHGRTTMALSSASPVPLLVGLRCPHDTRSVEVDGRPVRGYAPAALFMGRARHVLVPVTAAERTEVAVSW